MKKLFALGCLVATVLGLAACQSAPLHRENHAQASQSSVPVNTVRQKVAIDRTMVHSYHLGVDAHRRSYLLIVLNDLGVNRLNETARQGEPYDITLDGQAYAQSAQVSSGFLVLTPVAQSWTERRLAELLK